MSKYFLFVGITLASGIGTIFISSLVGSSLNLQICIVLLSVGYIWLIKSQKLGFSKWLTVVWVSTLVFDLIVTAIYMLIFYHPTQYSNPQYNIGWLIFGWAMLQVLFIGTGIIGSLVGVIYIKSNQPQNQYS